MNKLDNFSVRHETFPNALFCPMTNSCMYRAFQNFQTCLQHTKAALLKDTSTQFQRTCFVSMNKLLDLIREIHGDFESFCIRSLYFASSRYFHESIHFPKSLQKCQITKFLEAMKFPNKWSTLRSLVEISVF